MTDFTLDTSGAVPMPAAHGGTVPFRWSDFSPFAQGYVEALFASLRDSSTFAIDALEKMPPDLREQKKALGERCHWSRHPAWQSRCDRMVLLSLVAVVARGAGDTVTEPTREGRKVLSLLVGFSDLASETLAAILKDCGEWSRRNPSMRGEFFWRTRQLGERGPHWPPLTPYLDDTGKVRLREAG